LGRGYDAIASVVPEKNGRTGKEACPDSDSERRENRGKSKD